MKALDDAKPAYKSYRKHCGDQAIECAEDDLLGELIDACLIGRGLVAEMVAQEDGLRRVASSKALSIIEAAIAKTDRSGS